MLKRYSLLFSLTILVITPMLAFAQGTAFTYQGRLTSSGNPSSGLFEMRFRLFDTDAVGTGTQQGTTITNNSVQVMNGVFTVLLDFGANVFDGSPRFLEIGVRPAGSANPFTTVSPRQPVTSTPYAIQSLTATTAENALQLNGLSPSSFVQFNPSGNVGIGTNSPTNKLDVRGNLTLDPGSSPTIFTSTANTEQNRFLQLINSSAFPSASGLKAGGILVADNFSFANPGKNDLIVKGNVGIGTASPQSPLSVQIPGLAGYGLTHTGGTVTVGTFVDISGGWLGTRSNHPLHFFTNDSAAQMTLNTNGRLGIGTTSPGARLQVDAGNNAGVLANSQGNAVIGLSTGPGFAAVYGENTSNSTGFGVYGKGTTGYAMFAEGNAGQSRDKGGFVKAMVYVNGNGTILRCYNGQTGSSSGNCGFTVTRTSPGLYFIDFGFQIDDRFYSVSVDSIPPFAGVNFDPLNSTTLAVDTFQIDAISEFDSGSSDRPFMIIVY